jgi:hypothetical protein
MHTRSGWLFPAALVVLLMPAVAHADISFETGTLSGTLVQNDGSEVDWSVVANVCDPDHDGDLVDDPEDACDFTELGVPVDDEGCSSDQRLARVCPAHGTYRNRGAYVSCVAHEAAEQVRIGLIDEEAQGAIVSAAARSGIR